MTDRTRIDRSPLTLLVAAFFLASCGGAGDQGSASAEADGSATPARAPAAAPPSSGGSIDRADFVMCPALEPVAPDLAGIIGFPMDEARGVEAMAGECTIHSEEYGFVSAQLAPAFVRSIDMQAEGYEGHTEPAPGLGDGALIVHDAMQPHVIFPLRGNIIDVGAESDGTEAPDDGTMLRLATAVRDALAAANGG